ncbi:hypothetical protein H8784_05450 [Parabacteroides acidifaciens]|jgi:hypothetical protein|uniref:Uncharacterized protein n=1 Tax=Parabacteroides acidifaciens TaxID=2290935 RepID=A0A3D8HGZ2_9BACT|nr:hypothetical protein [Parabacteroides acidifaciens]MBC8601166.1 hypothetical protein [Parabacteroides acidifaciens]RDU50226.1 hypothetical protein DWU89_05565 [Parabacteroides acidifaciens]
MKATISLEGIWKFLQSLSLSANNKEWLGEKLLEEARKEKAEKQESYEDFIWNMCGAWKDDPRTTEEIIKDIRSSHQFGVTRHIMPLDDEEK